MLQSHHSARGRSLSRKLPMPPGAWALPSHFKLWKGRSMGMFKDIMLLYATNSLFMPFNKVKSCLIFQILIVL